jgi:hypothetical protein
MAFDITTTNTWESAADHYNPAREVDNNATIARMISEGKTDGSFIDPSPVVAVRYWRDLAAAQEFAEFTHANNAKHNCKIISIEFGTRESTAHLQY